MSVALENARLWEQEHLYRQALEREFEIGREIQSGFLPVTIPQPKGWEVAASLASAREVAGDFYDVFELPGSKLGLVIADVCDKGLGAALFMTLFRSLLRAASNIDFYTPETSGGHSAKARLKNAISLTNNYIAETHGHTGMFATVFFGILDLRTSSLTYVNCGHLSPLIVNQHGVKQMLGLTGPALGAVNEAQYVIQETYMEQGDLLFAFTDGLTEAENSAGQVFELNTLASLLTSTEPLSDILAKVLDRVEAHVSRVNRFDDIALLALRRLHVRA
jgi:sigma-B regulation protein RsbU (phosphoserine phosphatase)